MIAPVYIWARDHLSIIIGLLLSVLLRNRLRRIRIQIINDVYRCCHVALLQLQLRRLRPRPTHRSRTTITYRRFSITKFLPTTQISNQARNDTNPSRTLPSHLDCQSHFHFERFVPDAVEHVVNTVKWDLVIPVRLKTADVAVLRRVAINDSDRWWVFYANCQ